MKRIAALAVLAVLSLGTASALASNIAQIEAAGGVGTVDSAVVTAILSQPGTVNGRTYTSWSFAVNDGTGSMFVFGALPGSYTPTVGDAVTVSGTYSTYHQIAEMGTISAISLQSPGNTAADPTTVTIPDINLATLPENITGYMLTLNNVTIGGLTGSFDGSNLTGTISDGTNSMTLYYWPTSYSVSNANLTGMAIPTGPVNMTGFVSVYNSVAEFTPISITPEPMTASLLVIGGVMTLIRRRK